KFVKESQDERAVCFSLVLCDFLPFNVPDMVEMLNATTGFEYTPSSYLQTGERIWNLVRMFNIREGLDSDADTLPKRFFNESAPDGDPKGQKIDPNAFEAAKQEYYALRGWDKKGIPTKEKLASLGL
ncbi:MAG: aldehyde ferredoxin oxidoreductase C-terminal domain-containing protein, partial [Candidatus Hodarchaeales archaeon]